jgi:2'-5' RNA ligase
MRLFVAIAVADSLLRELASVTARLRTSADNLHWTAPESWHITLQFLGNASPEQLERLTARLAEVRSAPVPVQLGELGYFDRAGVFFAGVIASPALALLEQRAVAATSQCGFATDTRPFHPHITLARAKGHGRGRDLRGLQNKVSSKPAFTRFTAREFQLFESHLGSDHARYEVKASFSLGSPSS